MSLYPFCNLWTLPVGIAEVSERKAGTPTASSPANWQPIQGLTFGPSDAVVIPANAGLSAGFCAGSLHYSSGVASSP